MRAVLLTAVLGLPAVGPVVWSSAPAQTCVAGDVVLAPLPAPAPSPLSPTQSVRAGAGTVPGASTTTTSPANGVPVTTSLPATPSEDGSSSPGADAGPHTDEDHHAESDTDSYDVVLDRILAGGTYGHTPLSELTALAAGADTVSRQLLAAAQARRDVAVGSHTAAIAAHEQVLGAIQLTASSRQRSVEEMAVARTQLEERVLAGYVMGDDQQMAWLGAEGNPAVAKTFSGAVTGSAEAEARSWQREIERSDAASVSLACALRMAEQRIETARLELDQAEEELGRAADRLRAASVRLAVLTASGTAGMVFPVAGYASFGDTWHAPRSEGRLHKGTDIMAAWGTPLVAAEGGTVVRMGWFRRGGWRISITGESGMYYYYGHLAAYPEGITVGSRVVAGELIGWVGDTGNATGRPHLHWEIHPDGGEAVNPYPLARSLKESMPMPSVVPLPLDPALRAVLPMVDNGTVPYLPARYDAASVIAVRQPATTP